MKRISGDIISLDIKEAAEFLGFDSTERLRQKVKAGIIPGAKPGRSWVFLVSDLVIYIQQHYNGAYSDQIGESSWRSSKKKAPPTFKRGSLLKSQLTEKNIISELNDLHEQLRSKKPSESRPCTESK